MNRIFAALLILTAAFVLSGSTELERAPRPEAHYEKHDGFSVITFDIPDGTKITYTTDGSKPTAKSPRYTGSEIRLEESASVKLRVTKENCKTARYSYVIKVSAKQILKPKPLKHGDTIGIVAPGKYQLDGDIDTAVELIKCYGYNVKLGETCFLRDGVYAGTPAQRAADINEFFADDSVDAILCLRGGSGSMDILGMLDYDMIAKHPKLFIGFSDITVIHSALYKKCGLATVHGAMISNFVVPEMHTPYTVKQFFGGVAGENIVGEVVLPEGSSLKTLVSGTAQGRIVGGNLSRLCDMIGTKYEVSTRDSILFIEDVHESADSIEKMLDRLIKCGMIDKAEGIVFGEFTDMQDPDGRSWEDVIRDFAEKCGKPCIMGLPAGHDADNMYLPFGVKARVTADSDGEASLYIYESLYQ